VYSRLDFFHSVQNAKFRWLLDNNLLGYWCFQYHVFCKAFWKEPALNLWIMFSNKTYHELINTTKVWQRLKITFKLKKLDINHNSLRFIHFKSLLGWKYGTHSMNKSQGASWPTHFISKIWGPRAPGGLIGLSGVSGLVPVRRCFNKGSISPPQSCIYFFVARIR